MDAHGQEAARVHQFQRAGVGEKKCSGSCNSYTSSGSSSNNGGSASAAVGASFSILRPQQGDLQTIRNLDTACATLTSLSRSKRNLLKFEDTTASGPLRLLDAVHSDSDMSSLATAHYRKCRAVSPTASVDTATNARPVSENGVVYGSTVHLPRQKGKTQGPSPSKKSKRLGMQADFEMHRGNGGGAPLKRRSSWSRLNSAVKWLRPSNKSRNEDFTRLFGSEVPDSAVVVDDYSCALQRDILAHGRLYVTQEHFCFYANIFGWETFLVLACKDILAIAREKTAHVIPNAIKITARCEQPSPSPQNGELRGTPGVKHYFFTSFVSRETSFQVLMKVWQNVLIGSHMTPQHLRSYVCRQWGHKSDVDEAGSPFRRAISASAVSSNGTYMPGDGGSEALTRSLTSVDLMGVEHDDSHADSHADSPPSGSASEDDQENGNDDEGKDIPDGEWQEEECGCKSHLGKVYLDKIVKTKPSTLFKTLFTPTTFICDFYKERLVFAVDMEKWTTKEPSEDSDGGQYRTVSYKMPLNIPMGPKFASTTEKQHMLAQSIVPKVYIVQTDVTSSGVPMGNVFSTCVRACITRAKEPGTSRLVVTAGVIFQKSLLSMMKRVIEREALAGMTKHYTAMSAAIDKHFQQTPTTSPTHQHLTLPDAKGTNSGTSGESSDVTPESGSHVDLNEDTLSDSPGYLLLPQVVSLRTLSMIIAVAVVLCLAVLSWHHFGWSLGAVFSRAEEDDDPTVVCQPLSDSTPPQSSRPKVSALEWIELLRFQHALYQEDQEHWRDMLQITSTTLVNVSNLLQKLLVKQAMAAHAQSNVSDHAMYNVTS